MGLLPGGRRRGGRGRPLSVASARLRVPAAPRFPQRASERGSERGSGRGAARGLVHCRLAAPAWTSGATASTETRLHRGGGGCCAHLGSDEVDPARLRQDLPEPGACAHPPPPPACSTFRLRYCYPLPLAGHPASETYTESVRSPPPWLEPSEGPQPALRRRIKPTLRSPSGPQVLNATPECHVGTAPGKKGPLRRARTSAPACRSLPFHGGHFPRPEQHRGPRKPPPLWLSEAGALRLRLGEEY